MSALRKAQWKFSRMLALLLAQAHSMGLEVVMGECYRPPEMAALNAKRGVGIKESLHCICLAADINVFRNGVWLNTTEALTPLGEWWENQGGSWGGRFTRKDPCHFSLAFGGRK